MPPQNSALDHQPLESFAAASEVAFAVDAAASAAGLSASFAAPLFPASVLSFRAAHDATLYVGSARSSSRAVGISRRKAFMLACTPQPT